MLRKVPLKRLLLLLQRVDAQGLETVMSSYIQIQNHVAGIQGVKGDKEDEQKAGFRIELESILNSYYPHLHFQPNSDFSILQKAEEGG